MYRVRVRVRVLGSAFSANLNVLIYSRVQTTALVQVRFAFLAGVAVVLLLIPLNKWLAGRIESASTTMMAFKDLRIKRMEELLRGIRQIKAAAWEESFVRRVTLPRQTLMPNPPSETLRV